MKWSIFQQGNGILGVVSGGSVLGGPREKKKEAGRPGGSTFSKEKWTENADFQ